MQQRTRPWSDSPSRTSLIQAPSETSKPRSSSLNLRSRRSTLSNNTASAAQFTQESWESVRPKTARSANHQNESKETPTVTSSKPLNDRLYLKFAFLVVWIYLNQWRYLRTSCTPMTWQLPVSFLIILPSSVAFSGTVISNCIPTSTHCYSSCSISLVRHSITLKSNYSVCLRGNS
jgi:hypothetical protein